MNTTQLIRWIEQKRRVGPPSYRLVCGAIPVGTAGWSLSGKDNQRYEWFLNMPGDPRKGTSETLDAAKAAAECAFADWCVKARLVPAS